MTAPAPASLHVPDEPSARADAWLDAVHAGREWTDVLTDDDGLVNWLWARWSTLTMNGVSVDEFSAIVLGYRRELWLWLAGERTWAQACSGLVGRLSRRTATGDSPAG